MEEIKIVIPIKPLSVNRAWKGKRFKTPEYKAYERDCFFLLPRMSVPDVPLKVSYVWGFSNMASDVDNSAKLMTDILQKRFGFNDKNIMEMNLKKEKTAKGEEFIKIKIESL